MNTKRGRPRNLETQNAILAASYDLLLEQGFGSVTVEKIAERAGVSKATIYKWWPNKAAVVMDGFLSASTAKIPVPDTGSVSQDLIIHVTRLVQFMTSREGSVIKELVGEGQVNVGLAETYRSRYFQPRRIEASQIIERGIRRGELKYQLDLELCLDQIYGPIFYRLLILSDGLDESYVENLVKLCLEGLTAR
ncbi:TetR/AcrR family transcriptional regulator [Paenibacillus sp. DXFW5]|uniref:TetR/AcrR family transcriptional regulator n=1 Tax=Paenibacillus rhizolycopersici TaxID=2780073 RepID=A0ABS2H7L0_9BACL|nr:TetR/AcrR family transcriptional regulator [Paenibacillus rhizolycopersici]